MTRFNLARIFLAARHEGALVPRRAYGTLKIGSEQMPEALASEGPAAICRGTVTVDRFWGILLLSPKS